MAVSLRRSLISSRNIYLLRRTSVHSRHLSHLASSPILYDSSSSHTVPNSPPINFIRESRRCFAKGRKSSIFQSLFKSIYIQMHTRVMMTPTQLKLWILGLVLNAAVLQMEAAVDALSRELSKLRTGRASAGMLDHIIVETGGVRMSLSRLAVVSVLDSKTLSVTPYDPNGLKELLSAIVSSPLGLNPNTDGDRLIVPIPPLTKEHMQAVCKVVTKSSEDVKQSIRRARQKALDTMKKAGSSFPKDDAKRLEKEVDELTKKFIKSAEDMCKAKEKEIAAG
ncbi:Ribosome-recycling factor [Camellia lanceoleosa]|uniref:Ribosome-recycling factor n=1 Tax=Camellia lanceoleosa TaxID=1840588 RepID=A0ACC0GUT6_9ERIC|nr:Ribosome-recycling factor [Camellia lanceoleosa]